MCAFNEKNKTYAEKEKKKNLHSGFKGKKRYTALSNIWTCGDSSLDAIYT